ncbi:MAG: hypothetical protein HN390_03405 [Anaerolineae bacterium]|nr:hypothetical protein [Anaerolineae bacterium]MBT7990476.1 hypothetical protein [Anaerolineae bacterium]
MKKSLLTHIASNFISEYENVANSSVTYLLNEYPQAQAALKSLLDIEKVPSHYVTELSTTTNGRPDVTGLDDNGNKTIIIEGKFWANLTSNQPNNYLEELATNGKLLFLAPAKRLVSLEAEVNKRSKNQSDKIFFSSWEFFLTLVEKENSKDHDQHLSSDLTQMKELCKKMNEEGMPPLSMSDLDPMNGRRSVHFSDIINECNSILRKWGNADFSGLKTQSQTYGHGFYFRSYSFGCFLSFDNQNWHTKSNHTPIWLDVKNQEWQETQEINHALKYFDSPNSYGNKLGIVLSAGMDKEQAITYIVKKVKEVLTHLNTKLSNKEFD